jgi:hypothetical protein
VDELNQAVQVFCRHLQEFVVVSMRSWSGNVSCTSHESFRAYRLVLLVEVINVSIEDLDEELDRHGGVHAGVCHPQGALKAF